VSFDRDAERNRETVDAICRAGGDARGLTGNVADPAAAEMACEFAEEDGRSLKALVNCAAMRHAGTILQITPVQWAETIDACLTGTFLFCRAGVARMKAGGGGAIVNFSSTDAAGRKGMIAYATAKAAIENFTRCLAADHRQDRIRVNAIIPPFTVTGMTEHYPSERLAEMDQASPSGKAARPIDIAYLVRFLVSDESATLTAGMFGGAVPNR